jgi:hypothetical protein
MFLGDNSFPAYGQLISAARAPDASAGLPARRLIAFPPQPEGPRTKRPEPLSPLFGLPEGLRCYLLSTRPSR